MTDITTLKAQAAALQEQIAAEEKATREAAEAERERLQKLHAERKAQAEANVMNDITAKVAASLNGAVTYEQSGMHSAMYWNGVRVGVYLDKVYPRRSYFSNRANINYTLAVVVKTYGRGDARPHRFPQLKSGNFSMSKIVDTIVTALQERLATKKRNDEAEANKAANADVAKALRAKYCLYEYGDNSVTASTATGCVVLKLHTIVTPDKADAILAILKR